MLPSFTHSFLKPKLKRHKSFSTNSCQVLHSDRNEEFMDVVDYAEHETANLPKKHRPNERVQVIQIPPLEQANELTEYHNRCHYEANRGHEIITQPRSMPIIADTNGHLVASTTSSSFSLFQRHEVSRKQSFIVKGKEMRAFFRLLEDEVVQDFLEADSCIKISDKYLIAMVFAYFKRADLKIREYTRTNFFVALYLGNDMEEDEEEDKYEIFPWALGQKWQDKFPRFLRKRDHLWAKINYMALVSKRCCEEIMAIDISHPVWKRSRALHHAGAIRSYMKDPDDDGYPRGPHASPKRCEECDHDSQYDSASPASASWYISSGDNSPDDIFIDPRKSRFDMNRLKKTLQEDDDAWPSVEE
ncbi:speedy protein 1-B-like [Mytilus trossulus]|uniref:speedy protein 1-B-like n=1 Tax=Mytilus trossulus TaxID=6551 RepID=UPI00300606BC